jgi:hypothetical protein
MEVPAMNTLPFALRRVHPDGNEEPAGTYPTFALYRGGRRMVRFGFNRLSPRATAGDVDALAAI